MKNWKSYLKFIGLTLAYSFGFYVLFNGFRMLYFIYF